MCRISDVGKVRNGVRPRFTVVPLSLMLCLATSGCAAQDASVDPPVQFADSSIADAVTFWPVALEATEGRIEVYQPQPEAMKGDTLTARAAISLTRPGASAPVFGVAWFSARFVTDRDTRTVTLQQVTVKDERLTGSTATQQQDFARTIGAQLSAMEVTFPLDQLVTSLDTAKQEQLEATQIQTAPPHILLSTTPATLISVHGSPQLQSVEGHPGVSRVVNTPFILLFADANRSYYLKAGPRWVSAPQLTGPWQDTTGVPDAIAAAGADLATPATQPSASAGSPTAGATTVPTAVELAPAAAAAKIIVVTDPTELIVTNGDPQLTPVPGGAAGELLYASNTESDLFLDQTDRQYYVLLSGRWYAAASFQGPWNYVPSDHLPSAFAQIPADSPRGDVLSFVAATPEAHEAVLDAGIPQTANIRRDAGAALTVAYDGAPQFKDVPESPGVAYALNTPEEVLSVYGQYYCCHQAVWYQSDTPTGPWTVCLSVPREIYTLPPSCPDYNASYVHVYDYYPDYVTCGYLPGYTGTYVCGPTIVYGTGYDYPGWFGDAYFPPPCTWGFAAYYDPFACAWGFDAGLYWGGAGWFVHPWHDRWWRDHPGEHWGSHRWWGPAGFVHSHEIRDHFMDARSSGAFRVGARDAGLTARLPGAYQHGPGWNNLYTREGNAGRILPAARPQTFRPASVASGARDNIFAGSDGNVFRRSDAGWQMNRGAGNEWAGVDRAPDAYPSYRASPDAIRYGGSYARPEAGLDQDFAARSRGAYRSAAIHSFGGGGFRGGGFRGGGGRR